MKTTNNAKMVLQKYVDILTKHGVNVSERYMYGPVSLANLDTNDIDSGGMLSGPPELYEILTPTKFDKEIFEKSEIERRITIEAFVVDANKFENVVEQYSHTYRNFSFYGLIYETMYYPEDDKFYELPEVSKIRGAFWGVKPVLGGE